ncbi:protein HIDE1 [Tenrec ecaudatus]|uniref:protein HIDE1 n=1 Tax=Tenrec ecaudatus TaxID=94439 RepID=UPI003F59E8C3
MFSWGWGECSKEPTAPHPVTFICPFNLQNRTSQGVWRCQDLICVLEKGVGRGESPFQDPQGVQLPARVETLGACLRLLLLLSFPPLALPPGEVGGRTASGRSGLSQLPRPSAGGEMSWTVLLFAAGSLAIPAPSILLLDPHPSSHEDPIYIACMAPNGMPGTSFTLYHGKEEVQLLQAPKDQFSVTFNLSGGRDSQAPGDTFHCKYSVLGENNQTQMSDPSQSLRITFPVPTWILALSLSLAGAFLFLAMLVAIVMVIRKVKATNLQKKRERESCWAQINFSNTDMSFNNTLFAVSMKMASEEDAVSTVAASVPGPRKRPTSTSSSPEFPEFSTFRGPL